MSKQKHFLLDMDGVLSDLFSGAFDLFNPILNRDVTIEKYVEDGFGWDLVTYYGISQKEFWDIVEQKGDFWLTLKPFWWASELYNFLKTMGEVTIVTSPVLDHSCAAQKLQWLHENLDISSRDVFIGSKKWLMAGNGILIDDYHKNVDSFREKGGEAILLPSNWNTENLEYRQIKNTILNYLDNEK